MKRLIWLPVAGFLLVAGAAVAAAAPTITSTATSVLNAGASPSPDASTAPIEVDGRWGIRSAAGGMLEEVLADLVSEGVITQEQSDAIVEAVQAAADGKRADMEAELDQLRQHWEQIQGFLEDGVITQEEVNQLPEDSALRQLFNDIAVNGEINVDELRDLGPGFLRGFGRGFDGPGGGHHGPGMWFQMDDTDNSDSGSDSSSGSGSNS